MNWEINSLPVELTLSVPLIKKSKFNLSLSNMYLSINLVRFIWFLVSTHVIYYKHMLNSIIFFIYTKTPYSKHWEILTKAVLVI